MMVNFAWSSRPVKRPQECLVWVVLKRASCSDKPRTFGANANRARTVFETLSYLGNSFSLSLSLSLHTL
jgi:hypothetical protein